MKLSDKSIAQLREAITGCDVLITPNKRLAQQVLPLIADDVCGDNRTGGTVIAIPEILPFEQWAANGYRNALLAGQVKSVLTLSALEELALWREVIKEYTQSEGMQIAESMAVEAQKAFNLLNEYRLDINDYLPVFNSLPDSQVFVQWSKRFQEILQQQGLQTLGQAKTRLLEHGVIGKKQKLVALGFEKFTPLQLALFDRHHCLNTGIEAADGKLLVDSTDLAEQSNANMISSFNLSCNTTQILMGCAETPNEELKTAARWARRLHETNPRARIAVVVTDLAQQRLRVQRIFQRVFQSSGSASDNVLPVNETCVNASSDFNDSPGFNVSIGCPLKSTALINTACLMLTGIVHKLSITDWQTVLTSGYFHFGKTRTELANHLLRAMQKSGEVEFKFTELTALLSWYFPGGELEANKQLKGSVDLLLELNDELRRLQQRDASKPVASWLQSFVKFLEKLGWPTLSTLNSIEYQQYQTFMELRESMLRFDRVLGHVNMSKALAIFVNACQSTVFQPETPQTDAGNQLPQVLGLLEAVGQTFDAIWITGMSEQQWPASSNPNAFIPLSLQIEHGMPSASVDIELDYARRVTAHLLQSASEECVISWPRQIDDVPANCSMLVKEEFDKLNQSDLSMQSNIAASEQAFKAMLSGLPDSRCSQYESTSHFEWIDDRYGSPWQSIEKESKITGNTIKGGMAVLKDIANNPLQAYAKRRLGIEPAYPPTRGVRAYEKGNILHDALELIWRELSDSMALKSMDAQSRKALIQHSLGKVLEDNFRERYRKPSDSVLSLELEALSELLQAWLAFEAKRPDFTVIATELPLQLELEGLLYRGRIDRIELLDNQQLLLADYKTGTLKTESWQTEPLYDPQLPFYCLALRKLIGSGGFNVEGEADSVVAGIYLAGVKAGYIKYSGLTDNSELASAIAGFKALDEALDWEQLEAFWATQLAALSRQVKQGEAGFDPEIHTVDKRYESFVRSGFCYLDDEMSSLS